MRLMVNGPTLRLAGAAMLPARVRGAGVGWYTGALCGGAGRAVRAAFIDSLG